MDVAMRLADQRCSMERPADVHLRNWVSTELEYAVSTGDAIPTVSDILKFGVEWVPRVEPVGFIEDGPPDEFLPESSNEESEVCGQRPRPDGFHGEVDTEVCVSSGNEAGVGKAEGVKDR